MSEVISITVQGKVTAATMLAVGVGAGAGLFAFGLASMACFRELDRRIREEAAQDRIQREKTEREHKIKLERIEYHHQDRMERKNGEAENLEIEYNLELERKKELLSKLRRPPNHNSS